MISEDAKVRATMPPQMPASSTAASSTLGLTAAQRAAHEAARLNDPYIAVDDQVAVMPSAVSSEPFSELAPSPGARRYTKAMQALGAERQRCRGCDSYFCETAGCASPRHYEDNDDKGDISPTQPFPPPNTVRFADTADVDTPNICNLNDEDTGTALPARSRRPADAPMFNSHGFHIPHPDSVPYEPAEPGDQDPQPEDAQRPETPTDSADQLPLTAGPPTVLGPSPGSLIRELARAMNGNADQLDAPAPATTDADMLPHDDDMPPTLVASPPVETASPVGSAGGICVSQSPTDPWEKIDPWIQLTAYEQADGWHRQSSVEPTAAPTAPAASAPAPVAPPADGAGCVHPALMNMFSHISTQIWALSANLCEQATETRTALKTQADAQEKIVEKLATDVDEKLDIHKQEFQGMLKDTNNMVEKLAIRLASFEADEKKKGNSGAANDLLERDARGPLGELEMGCGRSHRVGRTPGPVCDANPSRCTPPPDLRVLPRVRASQGLKLLRREGHGHLASECSRPGSSGEITLPERHPGPHHPHPGPDAGQLPGPLPRFKGRRMLAPSRSRATSLLRVPRDGRRPLGLPRGRPEPASQTQERHDRESPTRSLEGRFEAGPHPHRLPRGRDLLGTGA